MIEPISGTTLGVKIAGFLGACASLMFVKVLKPAYAAATVAVGAVSAHYGTVAALWYWPQVKQVEEPIAFLIGLTAMNLAGYFLSRYPRLLDDRFGLKAQGTKPDNVSREAQR
jgi:hypothetical protein